MASKSGAVWSIDIGTCSMKALRLRAINEQLEVIDFDNIEHGRTLSDPSVTNEQKSEVVRETLREFLERHELGKDEVVISVPGQNSFARFIKLPPVEPKRIPEIIRFEAIQQIPFDINEVEWDWQLMQEPDHPDVEVGIFAIKNDLLNEALEPFNKENIKVNCVQMAPMALYNYAFYDRKEVGEDNKKAVIVLDMGAENTDLVICTKTGVWQRCIPLGGNAFTRAVAETFKLDFGKAEKLKRTAPMSKYARQIFQAMKPVFTDFGAEVQRSLGFYKSAKRQTGFSRIIIMGGGTKLQGIGKFLQQSLQVPVVKPDSFEKLTVSSSVSAAKFHDNVSDFGVVYGLALQGLGLGRIESNLLPRKVARAMLWAKKARYITAAAAVFLIVCAAGLARNIYDQGKYQNTEQIRQRISRIIKSAESAATKLDNEKKLDSKYKAVINEEMNIFKYRNVIPFLHQIITASLPNAQNNPEQAELYKAFSSGNIEEIKKIRRDERKQIFVTRLSVNYAEDIKTAQLTHSPGSTTRGGGGRGTPGAPTGTRGGRGAAATPGTPRGRRSSGTTGRASRGRMSRIAEPEVTEETETPQTPGGFVVTIEGYSPYKNIAELLEPVGVSTTQSKWGLVTRLMNLDKTFACEGCGRMVVGEAPEHCPDCQGTHFKPVPFDLYERTNIEHFKLETGEVEAGESATPQGVGLVKEMETPAAGNTTMTPRTRQFGAAQAGTSVLIDPMTREVISKVVELDTSGNPKYDIFGNPQYQVNDHWFRIQAKFAWKGTAKTETKSDTEDTTTSRGRRGRGRRGSRG